MTENLETKQPNKKAAITLESMSERLGNSFLGIEAQARLPVEKLRAQLAEFFNAINRVANNLNIFLGANDGYNPQLMDALSKNNIINLNNDDLTLLEELQTKVSTLSRSETFIEADYNQLTNWLLAHSRILELITGTGDFSPDADIQHTIQLLLTSSSATARGLMGADGALIGAVERYLDLTAVEKKAETQLNRNLATANKKTGLKLQKKLARGGMLAMAALSAACRIQTPEAVEPTPVVAEKEPAENTPVATLVPDRPPVPEETVTAEEEKASNFEFIDLVNKNVGGAYIDPAVSPQPDENISLNPTTDEEKKALAAQQARHQAWMEKINFETQILKENIAELNPDATFVGIYSPELEAVVAVAHIGKSSPGSPLSFIQGDALYLKKTAENNQQGQPIYTLAVYQNFLTEFPEYANTIKQTQLTHEASVEAENFNPLAELAKVEQHLKDLNDNAQLKTGFVLSLEKEAQSGTSVVVYFNSTGDMTVLGTIHFTPDDQTVIQTEAGEQYPYAQLGIGEDGLPTFTGETIAETPATATETAPAEPSEFDLEQTIRHIQAEIKVLNYDLDDQKIIMNEDDSHTLTLSLEVGESRTEIGTIVFDKNNQPQIETVDGKLLPLAALQPNENEELILGGEVIKVQRNPEAQEATPASTESPRLLESKPTKPEEVFDFSSYVDVFNEKTTSGTVISIAYDREQTRPDGIPMFRHHVRPIFVEYETNEAGDLILDENGEPIVARENNQALADLLLEWADRIERDTNKIDSMGIRSNSVIETPTLTVVDGGALNQHIENKLASNRLTEEEIINNLPFLKEVPISFSELDEIKIYRQGAMPSDNYIPREYRTIPVKTEGELELVTNMMMGTGSTDLYSLNTAFLFEDDSGKTTLICFSSCTSQSQEQSPLAQSHNLIISAVKAFYAASFKKEYTKKMGGMILGGTSATVRLFTVRETNYRKILIDKLGPLIESGQLRPGE